MAEQMRPANHNNAPDPSNSYERAHPENEAGMGRLDNNVSTPTDRPDQVEEAVENRHDSHQLNAEDVVDQREELRPDQPQDSMPEEELLGQDQVSKEVNNPCHKRCRKTGGQDGTP